MKTLVYFALGLAGFALALPCAIALYESLHWKIVAVRLVDEDELRKAGL